MEKITVAATKLKNKLQQETQIDFVENEQTLLTLNNDFGGMVQGSAAAVAIPKTVHEIQQLLALANKNKFSVTTRALGLSQSGQAVAPPHGIVLLTSALNQIEEPDLDAETITCQAGATWKDVVTKSSAYGYLPKVLPFRLELSIGGVLSAGGLGSTSHEYGPIINHVTELEIVAGSGEHIRCNRKVAADLFHAVLGGLGQHGVIVSATIALRPFKPKTRTFYLLYDDHRAWLQDQWSLIQNKTCHHLEAFCSASVQGLRQATSVFYKPFAAWLYPMQVSIEYGKKLPAKTTLLNNLQYRQHILTEDNETINYIHRYEARFAQMHVTGSWYHKHPWLECLLPLKKLQKILPDLLAQIPLALGDGHRVFYVATDNLPKFFQIPREQPIVGFAILPMGIPPYCEKEMLEALEKVNNLLLDAGGKRYLSGWLFDHTSSNWEKHYGAKYSKWLKVKQQYDPNHVLQSLLFRKTNANVL